MKLVTLNHPKLEQIIDLLKNTEIPPELESSSHSFKWTNDNKFLANSYFAVVAICHQTSPLGERRLIGVISGQVKYGWDYLKEKFLHNANQNPDWAMPMFWSSISPLEVSHLFEDEKYGLTLNRICERTFLINDLGSRLIQFGYNYIYDAFKEHKFQIGGRKGFLGFLKKFTAYADPVKKKSFFLITNGIRVQLENQG